MSQDERMRLYIIERVINQPIRASTPIIAIIPVLHFSASYGFEKLRTKNTITKIVAIEKKTTVNQSRAADAVCAFKAVLKGSNCYP